MNPGGVQNQIRELTSRLIEAGLSVKQVFPTVRSGPNGAVTIGSNASNSISLRDVPYDDVYKALISDDSYHLKLIDGGLLAFQYSFLPSGELGEHRLSFFPCPSLPAQEEVPDLYAYDHLYADIVATRLVRFPVRIDYVPSKRRELLHPASHLTLGQFENCRIPVSGPFGPVSFGLFIIRNFYFRAYMRNKNKFDRKSTYLASMTTIADAERRFTHLVQGR